MSIIKVAARGDMIAKAFGSGMMPGGIKFRNTVEALKGKINPSKIVESSREFKEIGNKALGHAMQSGKNPAGSYFNMQDVISRYKHFQR